MSHLTYAEAMVTGLIQGVTELFPVSSLGHNVLIPALAGGQWAQDLNVSAPESPYLAFVVGLHVATALAMIIYFWRDWLRITGGLITSVRYRQVVTADQRLAWMIVLATIPVGIAGLALEHLFRVVFSKPVPTALFLAANGVILLAGERQRRRSRGRNAAVPQVAPDRVMATAGPGYPPPGTHRAGAQDVRQLEADRAVVADRRLVTMGYGKVVLIGATQILALLPGISRDGIVTVTGMSRGLSREDAVRFSFLLSAPVILAAGVLKAKDLTGPSAHGMHMEILAGSLVAAVSAYLTLRFLVRYLQTRTLIPFAIYCVLAGLASAIYLTIK